MSVDEHKQLDIKKRKFRRNAAIVSFVLSIVIIIFYVVIGLMISMQTAKTMAEFNSIVIMQLGVFASILLGHLGIEYLEK